MPSVGSSTHLKQSIIVEQLPTGVPKQKSIGFVGIVGMGVVGVGVVGVGVVGVVDPHVGSYSKSHGALTHLRPSIQVEHCPTGVPSIQVPLPRVVVVTGLVVDPEEVTGVEVVDKVVATLEVVADNVVVGTLEVVADDVVVTLSEQRPFTQFWDCEVEPLQTVIMLPS
jgi:hypothetical protein